VKQAGVNAIGDFPIGSKVGVGCIVETCQKCKYCNEGDDQLCNDFTHTYNDTTKNNFHGPTGSKTFGG